MSPQELVYKQVMPFQYNCKTPLPTSIEGVSGAVQIVEFLRTHFSQLLNCVSNSSVHACEYGCDTPYEELVVSIEEVTHAIEKLDLNKACGSDGICSEHLKYASNVLVPLLAMCFTSFISHGFLPEANVVSRTTIVLVL